MLLVIAAFLAMNASARITSSGLKTAAQIRDELSDSEFRITPSKGLIIRDRNFTVRLADLTNFPALSGADVQTQFILATIQPGKELVTHHHPRASEFLFNIQGTFRVSFTTEGISPKRITNVIPQFSGTVFPQGLVHTTKCISSWPCHFVSTFNSADPGLIPA